MKGVISNIQIRGIVSAVPKNIFDNEKYVNEKGSRKMKKQIKLTGIKKRRVTVGDQDAADLATVAAEQLLKNIGWQTEEVDIMIFVTQSSFIQRPSTAIFIQDRRGLKKECMVFDINQGCAGYVVGMITIASLLSQIKGKALLLVGENHAMEGDNVDGDALLEGDGASATAIEYNEKFNSKITYMNYCDGSRANLLYMNHQGRSYMDGNAILLFGLSEVAILVRDFMKENSIREEQIDYYAFHQAQKLIVDGIAQEARLETEKVLYSSDEFGNASSASIPITLCKAKEDRHIFGYKNILMCGYGIGLTWGALYIQVNYDWIYPIIETDYMYNDRDKFNIIKEK